MTKEEICDKINNSYLVKRAAKNNLETKEVEIKIPVYKSKSKKFLLSILTFLFQKKAYFSKREPKISRIDFTKYVPPDDWIIYKENENNVPRIAIPKFVDEYENCWEINLTAEFYKEDLRFGVKPINIHSKLMLIGGGPIILGKDSNKYYSLGSSHWCYHDVIKEYDKFINNEKSGFEWEPLEIKIE